MEDKRIEELVRLAYQNWKASLLSPGGGHPDEEAMACFLEHKLSDEENNRIQEHILSCGPCAEALALQIELLDLPIEKVPQELIEKAKQLASAGGASELLEIFLKVKENALELIRSSGNVLVGQELIPLPVLRSRNLENFKDEIQILKEFPNAKVEVKIQSKGKDYFDVMVAAKERQSGKPVKDLRVTLMREATELESYVADSGKVTFEHVSLGRYNIELTSLEEKVAMVILDIKA